MKQGPLKLNSDKQEVVDEVFNQISKNPSHGVMNRELVEHIIGQYEGLLEKYVGRGGGDEYKWKIPYVGIVYRKHWHLKNKNVRQSEATVRFKKLMLKTFHDVFVRLCK